MNEPKTSPDKREDGQIFSDGGVYYLVHLREDGLEWRQLTSNALWHICDAAKRRSTREWHPEDGWVIDGKTHKAIYYYKAGEGYQKGWREDDTNKARKRKEAYKNGKNTIDMRL
jgi:23S rRNA C2498 (ribose-2'-O)-methylase RlmM